MLFVCHKCTEVSGCKVNGERFYCYDCEKQNDANCTYHNKHSLVGVTICRRCNNGRSS